MIEKPTPPNPPVSSARPREKEISVNEILKIILRRKFGFSVIIILSLITALFYHYSQTPEYRAVAVMMIKEAKGQNDMISAVMGGSSADNMAVKKDVKLLKSMPIAELVVRDLYKSSKRDSLEFFGKRNYISPVARLLSPLTSVFSRQKPELKKDADVIFRQYAKKLNGRIKVDVDRETNVLDISVSSPFPDESVFLSNTLCRIYKDADISRNSEKYTQASSFIAEMIQKQQKKVAEAD